MRKSWGIAAFIIVALTAGTLLPARANAPGWGDGSEKLAVIIGIDKHAGRTRSNVGAVGDAHAVHKALLRNNWRPENIRILTDGNANAAAIRDAFRWLAERSRYNTFSVVHYSGHVKQIAKDPDRDGEALDEFLWPSDNRFISDGEFGAAMRAVQGWLWVDIAGCEAAGLNDGIAAPNRLFTAASQEHQKGYEQPGWRQSVFTGLMVDQGLLQGKGDRDGNGKVSLHEAFWYAADHAPHMTRNQKQGPQNPYMAGGDGEWWYLFLPPPPPPPPPASSTPGTGRSCVVDSNGASVCL
jgi:hypothetical protein